MWKSESLLWTWKVWGQTQEIDTFNPIFAVVWLKTGSCMLEMFRLT